MSRHLRALAALLLAAAPLAAQTGRADPAVLDSIAGAGVKSDRAVGMVAMVVRGNETLLAKAYGLADLEWNVPMPLDAMLEVGSVAKQFAAVAILQLRDAGKLTLDDPITKWVPSLGAAGNKVTLRHLLHHTSGIFRFSEESDWEINYLAPRFPRDSATSLMRLEPFRFAPGAAQAYNNGGFWLLGVVVEKASGMKYEDYLAKRIFEPLGMTRSMYCNSQTNVPKRAHGYGLGSGAPLRSPMFNYAWVFAPGALCSTASDMITWLQALHGGKVLTPKSYIEMTTPAKLTDGTPIQYGMGIKVGENFRGIRYIGHGGTAPGFRADVTWYPDAKLAVVVLMNTSPSPLVPAGVSHALALEVMAWPRPGPLQFFTGDPAPFVGKYVMVAGGNQENQTIDVSTSPTGLAFSPNGTSPRTLPWMGGLAFYANEVTALTFRRTAAGMELHRDDAGNHVVFRKQ